MRVTEEQAKQIQEALRKKAPAAKCPACGNTSIAVARDVAMLPTTHGMATGSALPSVVGICANCGYTLFFNVFILGIADFLGIKQAQGPEAEERKEAVNG